MLRYIGNGKFVRGVPARDLSENEAIYYGAKRLIESGLYERVREKKEKPVEEAEHKEGE